MFVVVEIDVRMMTFAFGNIGNLIYEFDGRLKIGKCIFAGEGFTLIRNPAGDLVEVDGIFRRSEGFGTAFAGNTVAGRDVHEF